MSVAPALLRAGRWLERRQIRGGTRLLRVASPFLPDAITYPLSPSIAIDVPVRRPSTQWDDVDIATYETAFLDAMVRAASSLPAPIHLIDVGADIGIFALKLLARVPCAAITAYEPNPAAFVYLRTNLARLSIRADARCEGVADVAGFGQLCQPAHDADDHARFVAAGSDFPVSRVDDQPCHSRSVVLKIDTEGTERAVIIGASRTLAAADAAVVGFEAHREAIARTGIDPIAVVAALPAHKGEWRVSVAEDPEQRLDLSRAIAPQLREPIVNLVCVRH